MLQGFSFSKSSCGGYDCRICIIVRSAASWFQVSLLLDFVLDSIGGICPLPLVDSTPKKTLLGLVSDIALLMGRRIRLHILLSVFYAHPRVIKSADAAFTLKTRTGH